MWRYKCFSSGVNGNGFHLNDLEADYARTKVKGFIRSCCDEFQAQQLIVNNERLM